VLVSSRPHPELSDDIPAGHPLRGARPVSVVPFSGAQELAVLARQEIDDLLRRDDGFPHEDAPPWRALALSRDNEDRRLEARPTPPAGSQAA